MPSIDAHLPPYRRPSTTATVRRLSTCPYALFPTFAQRVTRQCRLPHCRYQPSAAILPFCACHLPSPFVHTCHHPTFTLPAPLPTFGLPLLNMPRSLRWRHSLYRFSIPPTRNLPYFACGVSEVGVNAGIISVARGERTSPPATSFGAARWLTYRHGVSALRSFEKSVGKFPTSFTLQYLLIACFHTPALPALPGCSLLFSRLLSPPPLRARSCLAAA